MTSPDSAVPPQTTPTVALECASGRRWICLLLGLVLFVGGIFVLWTMAFATIVAAMFFASALVIVGAFQIVHALYCRSWGALAMSVTIGLLYICAGLMLMTDPLATSSALTMVIAVLFLLSGIVRLSLAFRQWNGYGWILAASGMMGVVFAGVLYLGFPWSTLVVPGLLMGADLMFYGCWWIVIALVPRQPRTASRGWAAT